MGLRDGAYVRLWSAKDNGHAISCQASVSRKQDDGGYKTLFSGFVSFFGDECKAKIRSLGLPETADRKNPVGKTVRVVGSPDITSWYSRDTKENHQTITFYDVELLDDSGSNQKQSKSAAKTYRKKAEPKPAAVEDDDSELPF